LNNEQGARRIRGVQRKEALPDRPWLYGHRGASAEYPENSLAAFKRAMEMGVDAIETDVHLSADGHIIVAHDPDGRRLAHVPREIQDCTLEEIRSWDLSAGFVRADGKKPTGESHHPITLEELLEETGDLRLNIDLKVKDVRLVERIIHVLRAMNAERRVLLASFESEVLEWVRGRGYGGPTGLGRDELKRLLYMPRQIARLGIGAVPGDAAQVPVRYGPIVFGSRWFIDKCHSLGLRVDFWTINDPALADRLLGLGADGIMTDDPQLIAPIFEKAR
jgi:glycerophosphoryl diester phosphodiesterase